MGRTLGRLTELQGPGAGGFRDLLRSRTARQAVRWEGGLVVGLLRGDRLVALFSPADGGHAAQLRGGGEELGQLANRGEDQRADALGQRDVRGVEDSVDALYDLYEDQYELVDAEGNITPTRIFNDTIDVGQDVTSDITSTFTRTISDARTAVLSAADFQLVLSALSAKRASAEELSAIREFLDQQVAKEKGAKS